MPAAQSLVMTAEPAASSRSSLSLESRISADQVLLHATPLHRSLAVFTYHDALPTDY